jgi:maleamate amidohydrolase
VLVPEECVGDPDERQHRSNLEDVGRRYADVMTADAVEAYLSEVPVLRFRFVVDKPKP